MVFMYLCVNMNQVCRCDIGCHNMVVSIFFRHPKCQFMAVESTMFGSFGSTAISDISNRRHSHWLPFRLLLAFLGCRSRVSWLKFSPGHLVASCHERIHGDVEFEFSYFRKDNHQQCCLNVTLVEG